MILILKGGIGQVAASTVSTKAWCRSMAAGVMAPELKQEPYIKVQATIPGRPLWNNLKSHNSPKRGFSSIPTK